jgi:small subunit ribosomal protein S11
MASAAASAASRLVARVVSAPAARASTDAVLRASSAPLATSASADAVILIASTSNNIHATVSDLSGRVVARSSGGMLGYKHRARAAPQVGGEVAAQAAEKAFAAGHRAAHLHLKGPSRGRGQLLRGIVKTGIVLVDVRDVTPVPTPGTRPPAARRL